MLGPRSLKLKDEEVSAEQRHPRLASSSNFRDVGGYLGHDGRTIRWGMIYRSAAMLRFCDADWQWVQQRNIVSVFDLRCKEERELAPTAWLGGCGTTLFQADYDARVIFRNDTRDPNEGVPNELQKSLYTLFPILLAPMLRKLFFALLEARAPVIVHCSAGQDRTGVVIALALTALGVARSLIFEDYLLSTEARRLENEISPNELANHVNQNLVAAFYTDALRRRGAEAFHPKRLCDSDGAPFLQHAFTAIESQWGSAESYFVECLGIRRAEISKLRELYLMPVSSPRE